MSSNLPLSVSLITFVKNFHRMQQISLNSIRLEPISKFQAYFSCNIPQTVRETDGTHIDIKAPQNISKIDYFCRKWKYSVNAEAVVMENLMILDLASGYPGSLHDSRVLQKSNTFQMAEDTYLLSSQYDIIENARASPLILADGGSLGGMLERQGLSKIREILAS